MSNVIPMKLESKSKEQEIINQCCEVYGLTVIETKTVVTEFENILNEIDYRSAHMHFESPINQLSNKAKSIKNPIKKACGAILKLCIEKQIYQR